MLVKVVSNSVVYFNAGSRAAAIINHVGIDVLRPAILRQLFQLYVPLLAPGILWEATCNTSYANECFRRRTHLLI